jgi:hypothetical protein
VSRPIPLANLLSAPISVRTLPPAKPAEDVRFDRGFARQLADGASSVPAALSRSSPKLDMMHGRDLLDNGRSGMTCIAGLEGTTVSVRWNRMGLR